MATAGIAPWDSNTNSTSGPALAITNVTLSSSAAAYTLVTATLNVEELDPVGQYVIYFTLPATVTATYTIATTPIANGGYVQATNGVWSAGFSKDVTFKLVTTNTLRLHYGTYSVGTGQVVDFNCFFNTTYDRIQVDWQSNKINTAYSGTGVTTTRAIGTCAFPPAPIPLGASNTCWWNERYFQVDLRGTNYKINDRWIMEGWPVQQLGSYTITNNNQTVVGYSNGDCSGIRPASCPDTMVGGFFIQIVHL